MSDKIIQVKNGQTKTITDSKDDKKKYVIKVKGDKPQDIKFPEKAEKGTTSNNELEVEIKEEKADDKSFKDAKVKLSYNSGWFIRDVIIDKEIKTDDSSIVVTPKDKPNLDVKGYEIGFWIGIAVFVVVLAGLGYWWYISSKNDEEEAGL